MADDVTRRRERRRQQREELVERDVPVIRLQARRVALGAAAHRVPVRIVLLAVVEQEDVVGIATVLCLRHRGSEQHSDGGEGCDEPTVARNDPHETSHDEGPLNSSAATLTVAPGREVFKYATGYRPLNRGGFLARNARIPSCPSADRAASAIARASISICDSSVSLSLRSTIRLTLPKAPVGP